MMALTKVAAIEARDSSGCASHDKRSPDQDQRVLLRIGACGALRAGCGNRRTGGHFMTGRNSASDLFPQAVDSRGPVQKARQSASHQNSQAFPATVHNDAPRPPHDIHKVIHRRV